MSKEKKIRQLGMNPSTASHRLVKDLLWKFIVDSGSISCYRCSQRMTRENFSIDHIENWLDSEDPIGLYFNLDNITYSHNLCNSLNARRREAKCGTRAKYNKGCRCDPCKKAESENYRKKYSSEKRRERYLKTKTER